MKRKSVTTVRKHGVRYPWDDWFKANRIVLKRNKDFAGEPHGMMQTARQAARVRGFTISVSIDGDKVIIHVKSRGLVI